VFANDCEDRPGGKGANQALAAAAGGATVFLISRIGRDRAGLVYRKALQKRGVDVSGVAQTMDADSGHAYVTVDGLGENSIVVVQGANAELSAAHVEDTFPTATKVLLTQLEAPTAAVEAGLRRAKDLSILSILNASPVTPEASRLAALADIVIVNEHEHELISDLTDPVVTLGARGATWGAVSAAPPTVTPVDTTGAGDTLAGVLAAKLALGQSKEEALVEAVKAAALSTTTAGAQPWRLEDELQ
jgi:ribokinase